MILTALKAKNYKSYFSIQTVTIAKGFNLFIGANNSGKTSMLEALDFDAAKQSLHLSIRNSPKFGNPARGVSELSVEVQTSVQEMANPQTRELFLPISGKYQELLQKMGVDSSTVGESLNANPQVTLTFGHGSGQTSFQASSIFGQSTCAVQGQSEHVMVYTANVADDGTIFGGSITNYGQGYPAPLREIADRYRHFFYRFSAHRRISGQSHATGHPVKLDADAANLPYCLNNFQSTDPYGYNIFCKLINRVFPSVAWVQGVSQPNNIFEAFCLPLAPDFQRNDLAVPLSLMGTGVGNVVAILYVMLTSRFPQVIGIDEPNSFLHPKALRELLQILAVEGQQHQYLLTAHSADVISALDASHITIFNFDGAATSTRQVASSEVATMRAELSNLGIRMTDLHGRDKVLWVEGQTEEIVIPELLRYFCPEISAGTAVLRVEHTGKFDRRGVDIKEVANSYERLTQSALVPPMVAILLDLEQRSKSVCQRLEKDTNGKMRFLNEAMLENYVLDADAVAAVLGDHAVVVTTSTVQKALEDQLIFSATIDGAKILHCVFSSLSEARVEFRKVRDVPKLISWLLKNKPATLAPLGDFLREVFTPPGD